MKTLYENSLQRQEKKPNKTRINQLPIFFGDRINPAKCVYCEVCFKEHKNDFTTLHAPDLDYICGMATAC